VQNYINRRQPEAGFSPVRDLRASLRAQRSLPGRFTPDPSRPWQPATKLGADLGRARGYSCPQAIFIPSFSPRGTCFSTLSDRRTGWCALAAAMPTSMRSRPAPDGKMGF